jgi:signal transduction histidine kinase
MIGLQQAIATAAIALSAFSLITYLWLGLTVLLLGNRRARVTWVGGIGLLIAALFFLCHGALVGAGAVSGAGPADAWWRLSWIPAFAAPACWAAIGLHYVGLSGTWSAPRKLAVAGLAVLAAAAVLLAILNWGALNSYGDFIRLLAVVLTGREHATDPAELRVLASPSLSALAVAFVAYVGACACLPWAALVARRLRVPGLAPLPMLAAPHAATPPASGTEPGLLWDASSAWSQARPALVAASLCMIVAGAVVGVVGIITSFAAHAAGRPRGLAAVLPAGAPLPGHLPLALVLADLVVEGALAGLVLMLGWAVVSQGILVERRLPQRGFLGHWRGTVIVASIVAAVVGWLTLFEPESLPVLLVLLTGMATAYALFTWRSYAAHDAFLAQLRPFVASLGTSGSGWLATSPREVERAVEALFTSLCRDVLEASRGRLALSAGHLHRTFRYESPDAIQEPAAGAREWVLPVADERGVVARLALGPRLDGAGYTSADLEIARACGQRILDAVGEFTAVRTIAGLARKRGLEAELSAALPRRKLHDEVLPRLHLAMLRLEALRGRTGGAPASAPGTAGAAVAAVAGADTTSGGAVATEVAVDLAAALGEVVRELGGVHRELAALLRATPMAAPRRLAHGFSAALEATLEGELKGAFDTLTWEAPDPARAAADVLPTITADLLLGAAREALRNASRHGRGGDLHRPLAVRVSMEADGQWVTVRVADDGVGMEAGPAAGTDAEMLVTTDRAADRDSDAGGAQSGLLTHSALLALVGGSLAAQSGTQSGTLGGTTVTLRVPRAASDGER